MAAQTPSAVRFGDIRTEVARFGDHLRAENKSPRTIESYLESVAQLIGFLLGKGMPLHATGIRREHIEAYLNDLTDRGRSPATRALRYRSIRVFFGWLVDEDEVPANPMQKMAPPKVEEVPVPALTNGQITDMLKAAAGTDFEARRDTALLRFYFDTGARLSELAHLKVADLDMQNATARIVRKGGNIRVLPFGAKTKEAINRYMRVRDRRGDVGALDLWLGRRGRLEPRGIVQALRRRAREAGVVGFHVHVLRHTFANNYLEDGGSEGELIMLMGWSPRTGRQMAGRYTAANAEQRAHAAFRRLSRGDRL
jgi:site-specific recombinase XerD